MNDTRTYWKLAMTSKSWFAVFGLICTCMLFGTSLAFQTQPSSRRAMWDKVTDAEKKGLPKSAIEALTPIMESALSEKAYPEAIKAIAKLVLLESQIEGRKPDEHIRRMQTQMDKAAPEILPTLQAVQAQFYWSYFQQNRMRFNQRTATTAPPGDDFTTWDLTRLFSEIDKLYAAALSHEEQLRAIPIESYSELLIKGEMPDSYRPTLFDFIAFKAIDFYASGEQAGAQAEDFFEIEASSPALGNTQDFIAWKPETTDANSIKLKALQLYQRLLTIHQDDADKSAWLDADLGRLQFAYAHAIGEEKKERYIAALKTFVDKNSNHPLSATARFRWATLLVNDDERASAREIAQQGFNTFPDSVGGKSCYNLILGIETKEIQIETECVWSASPASIRVTYRNIDKVHFRAYSADWASRIKVDPWGYQSIQDQEMRAMLAKAPTLIWSASLPTNDNYAQAVHDVEAPKQLKPGYYYIVASVREDFQFDNNNTICANAVWVSDLALVMRVPSISSETIEGMLVNATSGEPVANASIRTFAIRNNSGKVEETEPYKTDAKGLFRFPARDENKIILATHQGHSISNQHFLRTYVSPPAPKSVQYNLFTDRSLYRPGQTIHFKGVCLFADPDTNEYRVVPNQKADVIFRDINGNEIEKMTLVSNDYGSFSGSFSAPRDRGTGSMYIMVDQSSATVQVEEYKRPKFEVKVDAPKDAPKLNDTVTMQGHATSYNGTSIQGANVRYRVTRVVRWPRWFMICFPWRLPPDMGAAQEIAHGWTETKPDGSFEVSFTAKPDRSVPESDEPNFLYEVIADVTDTTGETRTGKASTSVGYVALQADVSVDGFLSAGTPVKIKVETKTLDGDSQAAKGKVTIHRLKEPETVLRPEILGRRFRPMARSRTGKPAKQLPNVIPDPADPNTWALGEAIQTIPFDFKADDDRKLKAELPRGIYRAVVETQDRFGKPVKAQCNLVIIDPKSNVFGIKLPNHLTAENWKLEPGDSFKAYWSSGYQPVRAYIEIEQNGKLLQSFWTKPDQSQVVIEQKIDESMRGGLVLRTTMIRQNRAYLETRNIDVPWSTKDLNIKWERFASKLEPGAKDKWKLKLSGPKAQVVASEMVATLYDASLDAYLGHHWLQKFNVFRTNYSRVHCQFENQPLPLMITYYRWNAATKPVSENYRNFPPELQMPMMLFRGPGGMRGAMPGGMPAPMSAAPRNQAADRAYLAEGMESSALDASAVGRTEAKAAMLGLTKLAGGFAPAIDLGQVSTRSNLNESAFFFPQLKTDAEGNIEIEFEMPEALTTWRFMGFAHDKELRSGYIEDKLITAKDLMVQPNPPRFLREGDELEFSVKVSNQAAQAQTGKVALQLFDARTNRSIDKDFENESIEKNFELDANQSKSFTWRVKVPDGAYPIVYKAIGATEKVSDGEEGMLPVLSKRILVTESLPLPIRGKSEKTYQFDKLLKSGDSDTLKHQSLTVQMVSQPAWYAVLALPYLMEYPHECSEQTFNRMYANALARHIAQQDPKIERVFNTWREIQPEALDSPLMKNKDIQSILIEETPWLREAQAESKARRDVAVLFENNRLNAEITRAMEKLVSMQRDNGMWPWFPGGPDNEYLSLYIVTGFGRMRHLGVQIDMAPALKGIERLDAWMHERYDWIMAHSNQPEENHMNSIMALYLYGRSFFLKDTPIAEQHQVARDYWLRQARNHWLKQSRQSQAHLAVGLKRFGDTDVPKAIMASLRENSVSNEEFGMFWRDTELSWWWYRAPIETQAMMIEAFDEVAEDATAVEDCKVWLLKQKQTQDWKTTKATADAVYALLLRGENLLASDALVEVKLADKTIEPEKVEAGTGFYEEKFVRNEIKPEYGTIHVTKSDAGVSWGSVHWQYLEDIRKVTPHTDNPLKLEKKLFKRTLTKSGPVIEEVTGPVAVGEELVCRIVLRTDRDMEYVHLKDHRGSGTEPVNVLSRYRFQDGLAYYESTRDTASHFFIDYLPKGTYVFEYNLRVQHAGSYPTGLANIQCMYAPEFNSHSENVMLEVQASQ